MRDPERLGERSESELESALLGAGSAYRGSTRARAKTLAALGLAGSATVVTGSATAATSLGSLTKVTWLKVFATVAVVGTTAVPVGIYVSHRRSVPAVVAASRGAPRVVTADSVSAPRPRPEAPAPAPAAVPALVSDPGNLGSLSAPAAAAGTADVVPPARRDVKRSEPRRIGVDATLTQELMALDAVRTQLARGDAPGALSLLETYGRAYPHGDLALEAEVLRIDALARSGHAGLAKQRANTFLRRHPTSVLAARVRSYTHD